jgi:hypothetical protein
MNLDDLVRDAFDDMARDIAGPNEADLLRRFTHKDRVARARRATVAASGLALALAIALFVGGSAHGAATPQQVHVTHSGHGNGDSVSTTTLPRNRQARANNAGGAHQTASAGVPGATPLQSHSPAAGPGAAGAMPPATPGGSPSVSVPATVPSSAGTGPGPTVAPSTTTTLPPAFTIDAAQNNGARLYLLGSGKTGATIKVLSPYLDTGYNGGTFVVQKSGGWGGYVRFKISVGQTISVTVQCSCGESHTIQFTRLS